MVPLPPATGGTAIGLVPIRTGGGCGASLPQVCLGGGAPGLRARGTHDGGGDVPGGSSLRDNVRGAHHSRNILTDTRRRHGAVLGVRGKSELLLGVRAC